MSEDSGSSRRGLLIAAAVLAVVGLGTVGVVPRLRQRDALARARERVDAPRLVRVGRIAPGALRSELTLPATSAPFFATALYAKSVGFLRRNYVDAGDHIKRGQLLAEIEAPENDEEVTLARAQLAEAAANVGISQTTAARNGKLAEVGVVSRETADQSRAQANSAEASVKTREAQLQRVSTLRSYQRIVAPFDGVVTRRNFDPGALVGAPGSGGGALFEVAQVDTLRVFIDIPQTMAAGVVAGVQALVYAPSAPGRTVAGKVIRTSGVLDQSTRTLRTEVQVPGDGTLLPGSFVYVRLSVPRPQAPLVMPGAALLVRKEGTLVARVDGAAGGGGGPQVVHILPVQVWRDLGKEVELVGGVAANDRVVLNPPDDLTDGMPVRVAEDKPNAAR